MGSSKVLIGFARCQQVLRSLHPKACFVSIFFFKKHSWFGLEIMDRPRRGWSVATHILPELQDEVTFLWRDTREETHDWTQHQTTVGRHHLLHQSHLKTKMDSDLKRDGLPYSEDYTKFEPKLVKLIERNRQPGPFGLRTKVVWGNVFLISLIHVLGRLRNVPGPSGFMAYVDILLFLLPYKWLCSYRWSTQTVGSQVLQGKAPF